MKDYNLLNGLTLAYIGDAHYEICVRRHLIEKGLTKVDELHKSCIKYVNATAQALSFDSVEKNLTEEELSIFKRGRNANGGQKRKVLI